MIGTQMAEYRGQPFAEILTPQAPQARRTQRRHERAVEVMYAVPVDGMAVEHGAVVDFTPRLGICPVRAGE